MAAVLMENACAQQISCYNERYICIRTQNGDF